MLLHVPPPQIIQTSIAGQLISQTTIENIPSVLGLDQGSSNVIATVNLPPPSVPVSVTLSLTTEVPTSNVINIAPACVPQIELSSIPPPNPIQVHNIPQPEPINTLTIPHPPPLQVQNIPPPSPIQLNEIPNPKPLDLLNIPTPGDAIEKSLADSSFIKNIPPPNKSIPPPILSETAINVNILPPPQNSISTCIPPPNMLPPTSMPPPQNIQPVLSSQNLGDNVGHNLIVHTLPPISQNQNLTIQNIQPNISAQVIQQQPLQQIQMQTIPPPPPPQAHPGLQNLGNPIQTFSLPGNMNLQMPLSSQIPVNVVPPPLNSIGNPMQNLLPPQPMHPNHGINLNTPPPPMSMIAPPPLLTNNLNNAMPNPPLSFVNQPPPIGNQMPPLNLPPPPILPQPTMTPNFKDMNAGKSFILLVNI